MHDAIPKLSPTLFTAFKAYKLDTDRLATWLGDTAHSIGFDLDRPPAAAAAPHTGVLPGTPGAAPVPRLKGKARRAAKEQAAARVRQDSGVGGADPESPGPTCISVSQFIACAQFIADSDPPVLVPTRVIDWACRAIKARHMCADWFQRPATTATAAAAGSGFEDLTSNSNRTHAYFISVLEEVVGILAPRVGTSAPASSPTLRTAKSTTAIDLLESRFAALSVTEDDADADSNNWDAVFDLVAETLNSKPASPSMSNASSRRNKLSKPNRAKLESDHLRRLFRLHCEDNDDDEQEFVFALMEHLEALDVVTDKVIEVWQAYLDNHLACESDPRALEHASLITSIMCDKAQVMTEELTNKYPALMRNYAKYAQLIFEHSCADNGLDPWAAAGEAPGFGGKPLFGQKTWTLADYCYLPMLTVLERFRKAVQADQVCRLERPEVTDCPCCQADEKSQCDRLDSMESVVNEVYLAYCEAENVEPDVYEDPVPNPVIDALNSLKSLPLSAPIPLFTLFVVQLHFELRFQLDQVPHDEAHGIIRDHVENSLAPLMDAVEHYSAHPPSSPEDDELYIHDTTLLLYDSPSMFHLWLALDHGDESELSSGGGTSDADSDHSSQDADGGAHLKVRQAAIFRLFGANPWYAGTLLVRAGLRVSQLAGKLADEWQSVLNGAYLYKAIQLTGLDKGAHDDNDISSEGDGSSSHDEQDKDSAITPRGIRDTSWWIWMSEFLDCVGESRVFYGKAPTDMHSLWRTLNLTLENRSRTDLVFRNHLQPRKGRALPHSLQRIVSNHSCKPSAKGIVTLFDLFFKRRRELLGGLMVERFADGAEPDGPPVQAAVSSLEQAVWPRIKPGMYSDKTEHLEYESARRLSVLVDHVSDELRDEFVPLLVPNILMLHLQSVRILKHLREQILNKGRIEMMDEDCKGCRWKDSRVAAGLWNLIRALGGEEVTEPMLGVEETRLEKKNALEPLADVREYIVEMRETICSCGECEEVEE